MDVFLRYTDGSQNGVSRPFIIPISLPPSNTTVYNYISTAQGGTPRPHSSFDCIDIRSNGNLLGGVPLLLPQKKYFIKKIAYREGVSMKKLYMILPLALILCFMVCGSRGRDLYRLLHPCHRYVTDFAYSRLIWLNGA